MKNMDYTTSHNVNESQNNYAAWNKPNKIDTYYIIPLMWNTLYVYNFHSGDFFFTHVKTYLSV